MGVRVSEVLNADGMSLTIYVGGKSAVGINLAGSWVGTVRFYASIDGINFDIPLTMTPFPSGVGVTSATSNGNWFSPALNYVAIRAVFARTSGSVLVVLVAAADSSWQDAFLAASAINVSSAVASGNNTLTQAASTNRAWNLTSLEVSFAGPSFAGGSAKVTIYDGTVVGTVLFAEYIQQPSVGGSVGWKQVIDLPRGADGVQSVINTLGNAMTIVCSGLGSASSFLNAKFSAA